MTKYVGSHVREVFSSLMLLLLLIAEFSAIFWNYMHLVLFQVHTIIFNVDLISLSVVPGLLTYHFSPPRRRTFTATSSHTTSTNPFEQGTRMIIMIIERTRKLNTKYSVICHCRRSSFRFSCGPVLLLFWWSDCGKKRNKLRKRNKTLEKEIREQNV